MIIKVGFNGFAAVLQYMDCLGPVLTSQLAVLQNFQDDNQKVWIPATLVSGRDGVFLRINLRRIFIEFEQTVQSISYKKIFSSIRDTLNPSEYIFVLPEDHEKQ